MYINELEIASERVYHHFIRILDKLEVVGQSRITDLLRITSWTLNNAKNTSAATPILTSSCPQLSIHNDLQNLSLFLGRLYRYIASEKSLLDSSKKPDFTRARSAYIAASCLAPWNGLGYKGNM